MLKAWGDKIMSREKLSFYAYLTVTFLGALIFGYVFIKYIFVLLLPFLTAWAVAFSVRPMARKISEATKISNRLISVSLTAIIIIGLIALIVSLFAYAISEAWGFLTGLVESDALYDALQKILHPIRGFLGDREGAEELEAHIGEALKSTLSSLLSGLVGVLTVFVRSVPKALIFILVTVIASIYFALDLENINSFVKKTLPKKLVLWLVRFKNNFLKSMLKYLRAYLIIMMVTFIIMLFGFLVLGVKYAVLFAFVVALLDALPLIGVGTVLVPWSIYQLIFGNVRLGIGLIILFVAHQIIIQFIEPKIVGKNLGIHPVLSLILLYSGYMLLGFFGLVLIPLLSVVIDILFNKNDTSKIG